MKEMVQKYGKVASAAMLFVFLLTSAFPVWALRTMQGVADGGVRADLTAARIPFLPSYDQPISEAILSQVQSPEAAAVQLYEPAFLFNNLDQYVQIWRLVRQNPGFGKIGQSGILTIFAPYAIRQEAPALLAGVEPGNLPKVFQVLNQVATDHARKYGENITVDLAPEDFGIVVPSEDLVSPEATKKFIETRLGGPLTRLSIFGRQAVVDAFRPLVENVLAFVVDLKALTDMVGASALDAALAQHLIEGFKIEEVQMRNVSAEDQVSLKTALNTLQGL